MELKSRHIQGKDWSTDIKDSNWSGCVLKHSKIEDLQHLRIVSSSFLTAKHTYRNFCTIFLSVFNPQTCVLLPIVFKLHNATLPSAAAIHFQFFSFISDGFCYTLKGQIISHISIIKDRKPSWIKRSSLLDYCSTCHKYSAPCWFVEGDKRKRTWFLTRWTIRDS